MPIEVKHLGLQPKVETSTEIEKTTLPDGKVVHTPINNVSLVDSTETIATGAEIRDPEFAKLLDDTHVHCLAEEEKLNKAFGVEKITSPNGEVTRLRGDKIETAKQYGFGHKASAPRMVVPPLPWQDDRRFGEPWADYVRRTGKIGKTVVQYSDGRKLVTTENGYEIERGTS